MFKQLFITGTHDGVGKTVVARALLQVLGSAGRRVAAFKPVLRIAEGASPELRSKALQKLQSAATVQFDEEIINPVVLGEEGAFPGCEMDYELISRQLKRLSGELDHVIVEGSTGWKSLLSDNRPMSEWVLKEQLPVVMVVGIQQGCINHALLTAQSIIDEGLPLFGWVANRINPCMAHYAGIIDMLSARLPCPLIGEIPYLSRPEQRDLRAYIDAAFFTLPSAEAKC